MSRGTNDRSSTGVKKRTLSLIVLGGLLVVAVAIPKIETTTLFMWSEYLLYAAAVPSTLFFLFYLLRSTWWVNPVGRAVMFQASCLMVVLVLSVLYSFMGDYQLRAELRFVSFLYICLAQIRMLVLLLTTQRRSRLHARNTNTPQSLAPNDRDTPPRWMVWRKQ